MGMSQRFRDKTVLITGGGGDIGRVIAARLAQEGATIALLDIDQNKLDSAVAWLSDQGAEVAGFSADITDVKAVEQALAKVIERFGSVELLFNNAGYQGAFQPLHHYPADDFARVININVVGAFNVLRVVSQHMVERQFGRIVNTASMAGVSGTPNMAGYSASKFAVVGLTETAAKDLAPYNIRVNAISPGFMGPGFMWERQVELQAKADSQYYSTDPDEVAKQMINSTPMRRYGALEEIAGSVAFLMSDDASYITGINIPIAGG
ncbi:SDR family NAD(P)-dependent oxidoreductase [Carnimonas bestiolae]|uniref:SDR family NAD(P)-dependent oxidoreductase n=1 Tax=Carnimonas bestiolae TaxID=3402172 RepID=UPI003EDC46B3